MATGVDEARELFLLSRNRPRQAFILNNTANWQDGTIAAHEAVKAGMIGRLRHISCLFAAPLGWIFEEEGHESWTQAV